MSRLRQQFDTWPVGRASAAVVKAGETLEVLGDARWSNRIASVSKILAALSALVAVEEETIALDEPAGPTGSTVRHLLAHASGLLFDQHRTITAPGRRRIYSNTGIEQLADHVSYRAGMPFEEYQRRAVIEPLGMSATELQGSPAHDVWSTVDDLILLLQELMAPSLVSAAMLQEATTVQFPKLRGVLPGLGTFDPNPWGLGFEIRGEKQPHWTGTENSAATFGHFGGSGSFLWVDPEAGLAAVALSDRNYGHWAIEAWPPFSDVALATHAASIG